MPIIPDELKGLEGGLDITGKWILREATATASRSLVVNAGIETYH